MSTDNKRKIRPTIKNDTWTIRGVSPETRTAVKKAARRAGQTIGEWMDETLREVATDGLQRNLPAQRMEDQLNEISNKIDALQRPCWERVFRR